MALGKNSRPDSRRSSSYCSTATLVAFVALCLVGVWMMTSSAVVPVQTVGLSSSGNKPLLKQQVTDSKGFEDSPGDLPEDAIQGDANNSPQEDSDLEFKQNPPEKTNENPIQENREESSFLENRDSNGEPDDASKNQPENEGDENRHGGETNPEGGEAIGGDQTNGQEDSQQNSGETVNTEQQQSPTEKKSGSETSNDEQLPSQNDINSKESTGEAVKKEKEQGQIEENASQDQNMNKDHSQNEENHGQNKEPEQSSGENKENPQTLEKPNEPSPNEVSVFPDGAQSEILNEINVQTGEWSTQATESKNEKEVQKSSASKGHIENEESAGKDGNAYGYRWKLCNDVTGPDYIPCLDNQKALKKLHSTKHFEHRERHCPEEGPTCLVPLPEGYKRPIPWPSSRDKIWYHNVPHTKLAEFKGHQNWVKFSGQYLIFPGGGTQFPHGAMHYIKFIEEAVPDIAWGKRTHVVLDVGCGVASFGGYLFDKDVLTMSFAPKDEHEAQVQFALERGIPAISAVMGSKRLPFPSRVFDVVHCARCRVPWHSEGGMLLLELNRVLRPDGYFVWSATPVYRKGEEDVGIWNAMSKLTKAMCWDLVAIKRDDLNQVAAAIYRKPSSNECYEKRMENNPPLCQESDDPNAAWYVPLQACMHRVPVDPAERGTRWPEQWPQRVEKPPYWLNQSQVGVYGKAAPQDFLSDYEHWKRVVSKSYLKGLGISWSSVRNVMDMRSIYGGFAAALRDMNMWVMNVVTIDSPDMLPVIYERGLFGIYHDWCESFSTYPRTYDLLHADHLFSNVKKRCNINAVMAEVDRILRPEGKLIVRDETNTIAEVENMVKAMQWEVRLTYSKDKEGLLCVQKTMWRPSEVETNMSSMA